MYLQCMTKCHCQWPLHSKLGKYPQQGVSLYAVCQSISYFPRLASLHWQASQMEGKFCPEVYGFTFDLGCCALECKEQSKAFQVALATFQQLRHSDEYGLTIHVTYGTMLKCCAWLLLPNYPMCVKWVQKVFCHCFADGCVGDMVLSWLQEAVEWIYTMTCSKM